MGTIEPFMLCIGMWADVLADVPPHLYERIRVLVKVFALKAWLVKQYK